MPQAKLIGHWTNCCSFFSLGAIDDETKAAFVSEVERVGRDPVYWVRREASFAVGALAKVVPQEVVLLSLVRNSHSMLIPPIAYDMMPAPAI
jgi:hypothetical protein